MFKIGDKVRCIDDSFSNVLKRDITYIVEDSRNNGNIKVEGIQASWHSSRFELVKEEPMKVGKKYIYRGDLNSLATCIGFGLDNSPVIEKPNGSVFKATCLEYWTEYVEPKSGTIIAYIYESPNGGILLFREKVSTLYEDYKLLATKEVSWTEGDVK